MNIEKRRLLYDGLKIAERFVPISGFAVVAASDDTELSDVVMSGEQLLENNSLSSGVEVFRGLQTGLQPVFRDMSTLMVAARKKWAKPDGSWKVDKSVSQLGITADRLIKWEDDVAILNTNLGFTTPEDTLNALLSLPDPDRVTYRTKRLNPAVQESIQWGFRMTEGVISAAKNEIAYTPQTLSRPVNRRHFMSIVGSTAAVVATLAVLGPTKNSAKIIQETIARQQILRDQARADAGRNSDETAFQSLIGFSPAELSVLFHDIQGGSQTVERERDQLERVLNPLFGGKNSQWGAIANSFAGLNISSTEALATISPLRTEGSPVLQQIAGLARSVYAARNITTSSALQGILESLYMPELAATMGLSATSLIVSEASSHE